MQTIDCKLVPYLPGLNLDLLNLNRLYLMFKYEIISDYPTKEVFKGGLGDGLLY